MDFGDKKLFIAHKIGVEKNGYGDEVPYYKKPERYSFSYMPTGGQLDYQVYGTLINNMFTSYIPMFYLGKIKSGDLAYLIDGETQDIESLSRKDANNKYCPNANYLVKIVQPQNMRLKILFEKININN